MGGVGLGGKLGVRVVWGWGCCGVCDGDGDGAGGFGARGMQGEVGGLGLGDVGLGGA